MNTAKASVERKVGKILTLMKELGDVNVCLTLVDADKVLSAIEHGAREARDKLALPSDAFKLEK